MLPPDYLLEPWRKFDHYPMETLTKAWFYNPSMGNKQREVGLMKEHRQQYGISGNCFDLALLLLDQCRQDGVEAYPIGLDLFTDDAHVAVLALDDRGNRYLCDLGDQWVTPILIEGNQECFSDEKLEGFFPAAKISVEPGKDEVIIHYHRSNGKISRQRLNTVPLEWDEFMRAAEFSQNLIKPHPLLECRVPSNGEMAHWEFYNWESYLSTDDGLYREESLKSIEQWVEKIRQVTNYDRLFLYDALKWYENNQ